MAQKRNDDKCVVCGEAAKRLHCNHDTGVNEHLCETHYAKWHPELANINRGKQ